MNNTASNFIILENGMAYLSNDEFTALNVLLAQNSINLSYFQNPGPKASLNDINIFISQNITELMTAGILLPAVYDVIKAALKTIVYKIKGKVKILQSGKVREAVPCLTFKTVNGEIKAPIPTDLTEDQFERYMDELERAIESIRPDPLVRYEIFIAEQNEKTRIIEVKTMLQYAHEQYQKQEMRK